MPRHTSRSAFSVVPVRLHGLATLLVLSVLAGPASRPARCAEQPLHSINYAFATQIGSGIYRADGRTVHIYRLSLARRFKYADEDTWGFRLVIRTTLGFYGLRFDDLIGGDLPDRFQTLSIVPELEFEAPARRDYWRLLPFVSAGGGKDFQGGKFNFIFATGVRNWFIWPWKAATHFRLGNRLVYSVATTRDVDFSDDFGLFETTADLRKPLGFSFFKHAIDGSVYAGNYLFFISPRLFDVDEDTLRFATNWEIGVTLGTVEPWRVLGFQLPRIGVGYRFDSRNSAVRILIGETVPIAPPGKRTAAVE